MTVQAHHEESGTKAAKIGKRKFTKQLGIQEQHESNRSTALVRP
jgi:hypothetical protein